jgi:hypothetical protein
MITSPRLKYPLVAGMGITNVRVAAATSAAKIAPSAILSAGECCFCVGAEFFIVPHSCYNCVISIVAAIV